MKSCVGFKKSCWLPVSRDDPHQKFCRSCLALEDREQFQSWLNVSPANPEEFFQAPIQRHIIQEGNTQTLDQAFGVLVATRKLGAVIPNVFTLPSLHSTLLLRFRTHSTPNDTCRHLCKVYTWCLTHGYGDTLVFPESCLYCLTARMNYCRGAAARQPLLWLSRQQYYSAARSCLLWNHNAIDILLQLYATYISHYNTSDVLFELLWLNIFQKAGRQRSEFEAFNRMLNYHPLVLRKQKDDKLLNSVEFRQFLKQRIEPMKEEFAMVAWHPDRFFDWCLDEEEKGDMVERWAS